MGDNDRARRYQHNPFAVSYQTKAKPVSTLATMDQTELAHTYGNPATKSFRKQHIRLATAAGTSVLVNSAILNITAALLTDAVNASPEGWPERITAWEPLPKGAIPDPRHYGLALPINTVPESIAARHGFTRDSDWLVFTGDQQALHAAAVEAETAAVLLLVGCEENPDRPRTAWESGRPGSREPGPGDKGDDVQFFQLLYNTPNQDGIMTEFDTALITELQRRWGIEQTGTITADTWRMLLPNQRTFMLDYGDINHTVKILQALLTAYDWTDGNLPITGRFDQPTARALANVQETYGLRNHPAAGTPEWAAILGRWPI